MEIDLFSFLTDESENKWKICEIKFSHLTGFHQAQHFLYKDKIDF